MACYLTVSVVEQGFEVNCVDIIILLRWYCGVEVCRTHKPDGKNLEHLAEASIVEHFS